MNSVSFALYAQIVRVILLLLVGVPLVRWSSFIVTKLCIKRFSQHIGLLLGNSIFYAGLLCIIVTILHEFGFNIAALLGAAGVFGIAIGFASQTSVSNIISGFFLLLERPFSVGDIIKSHDTIGYVEAIDLLSVRVRTLDNKMVRLPNEMVLKHSLHNLTYYPSKRVDCVISLPYNSDIIQVQQLIYSVVKANNLFLKDPTSSVSVNKIAQHDYDTETRVFLNIRVWVATQNFRGASAVLMQQLKEECDKNGIIITIVPVN